jgi:hypothetical protein
VLLTAAVAKAALWLLSPQDNQPKLKNNFDVKPRKRVLVVSVEQN